MSDENKCFARPKVRFSRSAESPDKSNSAGAFAKPKIRSIVNFGPSVKILKAPSSINNDERCSSPEETNSRYSAGDAPNDLRLCPVKTTSGSAPCLTEIILTPENHRPSKASKTSKVTILPDKRETSKTAANSLEDNFLPKNEKSPKKSSPSNSDKSSKQKAKEPKKNLRTKLSENRLDKENLAKSGESKENIPKVPQNTLKSQSDSGTKIASDKSSKAVLRKKLEAATTKLSRDVGKNVKTKPAPIGLMPCMKAARDRRKSVPTKKTILRDAIAVPSQVYVGPGVARPRSLETQIRTRQEPLRSRSEILSGDKLSRPEYNSIVNTIKKLQEARDEKVAKDLEHLPAVYRRLVDGKVSSALDFGANEAIYRDLVDLTIDEKQLPLRLTRSKDPEPRQRDLVPKLSDFFVPTNDEEYRKAVLIRPPSPRVLDTWNPYKVSDRIFSWKESLDHDH